MKAIIYTEYGPPEVLKLREIEKPVPKNNEVVVKIYGVHVNFGDMIVRNFKNMSPRKFYMPLPLWIITRIVLGLNTPRINIVGSEYSGVIEAIGKDVTRFKIGDEVFGYRSMNMGANAEYMSTASEGLLTTKPKNMTFEESATVPYGALTALNLLRKVNIKSGQKILINGASGSIGSQAVQLAKYFGAEVTGVCSTPRLDFVKSMGADNVIDYTKEDFTQNGETYDLIFDILGKSSFSKCKNSLEINGRYLLASFKMKQLFQMIWTKIIGSQKVICAMAGEKVEDLQYIKDLIEGGYIKSFIDKRFTLEQTAEAHKYIENGLKKGQVVIVVKHNS